MSISEINALLRSKDKSGNDKLIYPITKADNVDGLEDALSGKVNKVSGKGLSSNDYTTTDKNKVNAIPNNPKYADTVYDDSELRGIVNELQGATKLFYSSQEPSKLRPNDVRFQIL